jgi:hypothetical protein
LSQACLQRVQTTTTLHFHHEILRFEFKDLIEMIQRQRYIELLEGITNMLFAAGTEGHYRPVPDVGLLEQRSGVVCRLGSDNALGPQAANGESRGDGAFIG